MLLEDSKKLEKFRKEQMEKEEAQAFIKRKEQLKAERGIDFDEKPKKRAGRPKGSKNKKEQL